MKYIAVVFAIFHLLVPSSAFGQQKVGADELKSFWKHSVLPLIQKDRATIDKIVHFPLAGDWGFMMELDKAENEWTKQDFEENFNKLFTPELLKKLKSMGYQNVDIHTDENGLTELIISVGQEQWVDGFKDESAIVFRYRKIRGKWMLFSIHAAG
jgi:hypothetical protein